MSGIYIPGMELPENCICCDLSHEDGWCPAKQTYTDSYTFKTCPLVHVPPHGLIAREQILDAIRLELAQADACNDTEDYDSWMRVFDYVRKFPTFIPADKPEEVPS